MLPNEKKIRNLYSNTHEESVVLFQVSSDRIVSCSDDGSIRIWDLFDPRKKTSVEMQIRQLHHE